MKIKGLRGFLVSPFLFTYALRTRIAVLLRTHRTKKEREFRLPLSFFHVRMVFQHKIQEAS
jgi:hypothetical protein